MQLKWNIQGNVIVQDGYWKQGKRRRVFIFPKAFWAVPWGDMTWRALTPYPGNVYEKPAEEKEGRQEGWEAACWTSSRCHCAQKRWHLIISWKRSRVKCQYKKGSQKPENKANPKKTPQNKHKKQATKKIDSINKLQHSLSVPKKPPDNHSFPSQPWKFNLRVFKNH